MITPEQREARKKGIGASDTPIIMGFSSYKTPYQLYLEKLGLVDDTEKETEAQYWGNKLERPIMGHFIEANKVEVTFTETVYHQNKSYMFANLDGYIPAQNAVVEIKNSREYMRSYWGEDGSNIVPMQYLVQLAHQCIVANASKGYLAVLIGGNEYRQYEYHRDTELEKLIIEAVDRFWLHNVLLKKEPDSINIEDSRLKYKTVTEGLNRPADVIALKTLEKLREGMSFIKKCEDLNNKHKMELIEFMKDAECLTDETGKPLLTLKADKKGTRRFLLK